MYFLPFIMIAAAKVSSQGDFILFLTASRASLAVLGIAFRRRHRRRQHFWKICCISELF